MLTRAEVAEALELEDAAMWTALGPGWHELYLVVNQREYPFVWVLIEGEGESARPVRWTRRRAGPRASRG